MIIIPKMRLYDKVRKKMIYPDDSDYDIQIFFNSSFTITHQHMAENIFGFHIEKNEDYELMWYSGKKDIDGKEIYEKDFLIIGSEERILYEVKFENGTFSATMIREDGSVVIFPWENWNVLGKIIGHKFGLET